ncbi:CLUMA_CG008320, isoform A [Clunio marinus]|uniref:CLUMA_CG008320, isoform A n=1 Tax=Clunio marinus TaxID=568069 RepID=A0A1J1I4Z1_9DIPT|nr:CLUMA_CG008320, isoform A [Clunio marinus]
MIKFNSFVFFLTSSIIYADVVTAEQDDQNASCTYEGKVYQDEEFVYREQHGVKGCTDYYCMNGSVEAYMFHDCAALRTDKYDNCTPIFREGECCPTYEDGCGDEPLEHSSPQPNPVIKCTHEGKVYQDEEFVYREQHGVKGCTDYYCMNGSVEAYMFHDCAASFTDRFNNCTPIFRERECCPILLLT